METKKLIKVLGFKPKENTSEIYHKKYSQCNNYEIEVDFSKKTINFGEIIKSESKTTQNFSKVENWVVLECVDRLLEKGYKPKDITLEKTFKVGHGASGGRLDIFVTRDNEAYLMIECKTWEAEFDKEFKNLEKNGGQLFTYFQQDNNAEVLMLYTSKLDKKEIIYKNEIVKIEDHYRQAGNVEDVFDRWNKVSNSNGVFENWVKPYLFENKKLTKEDLRPLNEEDSQKIFYQFLSILRKHSISDKSNAFNKIFNLFLAKIYDEKKRDNKELDFQWKEHKDNAVDFQVRLINLYKDGMDDFLKKEIAGISDDMFGKVTNEELKARKKHILLFNKVFDIKDVFDDETFDDNQRVLKEVVQLLQNFKIRYPRKQQHLSDFFERLLTTGLKQEAGQFFTPPPITRFIIKSLPISKYIKEQLNKQTPELPAVIDYSVGSGHFITEVMEEYQRVIEEDIDTSKLETDDAETFVNAWKINKYDWASKYIYGIEKDYRLVKVAKVGCYFYGDGLAQVIHGDGLDSFKHSKSYRGLLKKNAEKPQFSFIVSNPPYSVSSFKGDIKNINVKEDFKLYDSLTDRSSEIECLFVERTKQLLKTNGIASIILPSSILSNTGIYTQAREIILKHFDIIAIAELGSATFMATGTNTVTLFLKRRKDEILSKIEEALDEFFINLQDVTINGIEKPISKYISHVWENIKSNDYKTLLQKTPNKIIEEHEIYKTYKSKKLNWTKILELEKEKLFYFILAYNQKIVLLKTGQKKEEKQFLGYEFSNRRGSEGIHPIQRGKKIDDCTQLYDATIYDNPDKASTYIYKAFTENNFDLEIPESLQKNVSYQNLVDMLTFDRIDFEKRVSLSAKKKVKIKSKWETEIIGRLIKEQSKSKIQVGTAKDSINGNYIFFTSGEKTLKFTEFLVEKENIFLSTGGNAIVKYYNGKAGYSTDTFVIQSIDETKIKTKYIFLFLENIIDIINEHYFSGVGLKHLQKTDFRNIKIPLPPKEIQEKIVSEIEILEKEENKTEEKIANYKTETTQLLISDGENKNLGEICDMKAGKFVSAGDIKDKKSSDLYPCYGGNGLRGYTETFTHNGNYPLIGRQGALCGNIHFVTGEFHATEHAVVATPLTDIEVNWLYYQLIKLNLNQYATGTAQPGLSVTNLNTVSVIVPTISKQKKIVAEIQKLEKKITDLENKISTIPQRKEEILKKYLE